MDTAPDYATSETWPSPNPPLAAALIGSVLAAQGFAKPVDRHARAPWAEGEFNRCAGWIEAALKGQGLTLDDVREGVRKGWYFLFPAPDGVMVAEFIVSPRMRGVHVLAAGGTLRAMAELTPRIEEFARQAGCNYGGATGRKGWVRWLRRFGYSPSNLSTVEKAL